MKTAELTPTILEEMMTRYNEYLEKWILKYGSEEGFNEWFTSQIK
jgi:hypothetical protein